MFDKLKLKVDKNLLDAFPDGLTLVGCTDVTLADDLTSADVIDRLAFYDCKTVTCPTALESAVQAVSSDVNSIALSDAPDGRRSPSPTPAPSVSTP